MYHPQAFPSPCLGAPSPHSPVAGLTVLRPVIPRLSLEGVMGNRLLITPSNESRDKKRRREGKASDRRVQRECTHIIYSAHPPQSWGTPSPHSTVAGLALLRPVLPRLSLEGVMGNGLLITPSNERRDNNRRLKGNTGDRRVQRVHRYGRRMRIIIIMPWMMHPSST